MQVGTKVICLDENYGNGEIVGIGSDKFIYVKFEKRNYPTMCSTLTNKTVHCAEASENVSFKVVEEA